MTDLSVEIAGIKMKNPVMLASGTCGYGRELADLFPLSRLGGIMVKGTTLEPRPGNPVPRILEGSAGVINSVGLQNPGVEKVVNREIPWISQQGLAVLVNIAGRTVEDYAVMAVRLDEVPGIDGLEVNISCPNVASGGFAFGTDAKVAASLVKAVRKRTKLPLIVKLTPNVTDIVEIACAVEEAGADAVSLVNTFLAMSIDVEQGKPFLYNKTGGYSGPAIRPIALRMVWQVAQKVRIPVIGMGGIVSVQDTVEFLMAGARGIAIGTGTMIDPYTAPKIVEGLGQWLESHGYTGVSEIIGKALPQNCS